MRTGGKPMAQQSASIWVTAVTTTAFLLLPAQPAFAQAGKVPQPRAGAPASSGTQTLRAAIAALDNVQATPDAGARLLADSRRVFALIEREGAALPDSDLQGWVMALTGRLEVLPPTPAERATLAGAAREAEDRAARAGNGVAAAWLALASSTLASDPVARVADLRRAHGLAVGAGAPDSGAADYARAFIDQRGFELIGAGSYQEAADLLDALLGDLAGARAGSAPGIGTGSRIELVRRRAEAYAMLGRIEEANRDWDEALAAAISTAGPNSDAAGTVHNQRSYFLNLQGRFAEAEAPGLAAARIWERTRGRRDLGTQKARYNYATALLGQGNAAAALPFYLEALPIQRGARFARVSDTAILQTTIARTLVQISGREVEAVASAREAMDIVRQLRDQRLAGATGMQEVDAGLSALSRALAAGQRRQPLSAAFDVGLLAAWNARQRDPGALDIAFRAAQDLTLSDTGDAINQATARRIAGPGPLGQLVRERQDAAQAALAADAALREAATGTDRAASDRAAAARTAAGQRLAALDARLSSEFPAYRALVEPGSVTVAEVQAALRPDQAMLLLMASEGHHYAFAIAHDRVAWHRVDGGAERIGALVTRLRCRIDEVTCSVPEFDAAVAAEQAGPASPIDQIYPRFDRGAAHRLYRDLVAPVESALPQGGRVYVVASGPMATLPMATLVTADPGRDAESGDAALLAATPWLGDRYAFVTLGSVSALSAMQRAAQRGDGPGRRPVATRPGRREVRDDARGDSRGERRSEARAERRSDRAGRAGPGRAAGGAPMLVGYGAPVLEGNGGTMRGGGGGRRRGGVSGLRATNFQSEANGVTIAQVDALRRLDPLPGTATELQGLAAGARGGSLIRIGAEATEAALKGDPAVETARTLVFATHGLLPGEMGPGSEPGLVFTPPRTATPDDDGLLTASEVAAMSLSARYVILSACNTATGDGAGGGESLSALARSFLYAGADALLASHWRVADDATAALMLEAQNEDTRMPSRALQAAMRAVRTGRREDGSLVAGYQPHWAHPSAWAPFTLISNGDR